MVKYNIEEGIDFYNELNKSLDINNNHEGTNICLITNQLLTDKYVTLECGHKFNYVPLYNDLKNHKRKFNYMEGCSGKLRTNEIRCPYCRSKQTNVLPYYEELGVEKINGVNFYDENIKETYGGGLSYKCQYTSEECASCSTYWGTSKILIYNNKDLSKPITFGDNKHYCYTHKRKMIKDYKLKEKEKEKQAKQKQKEEAKLEKQKQKEEAKLAKQNSKFKNIKNVLTENVVLESSIVINQEINHVGCVQILKTGLKKGKSCGCKIYAENVCKRHHLLINKVKI
jgi:hypothetical protein